MDMLKQEKSVLEIVNNNAPEAMVNLAQKWADEGKSFYIGPENIFYYNNAQISYHGADEVSRKHGSWSVHTCDCPVSPYWQLKKEEIEQIAFAFAKDIKVYSATLFLSNKCNSRCFCCGYHGEKSTHYDTKMTCEHKVVDYETAVKRVDKLYDMGVQVVSIAANGDTLVYKDWEKLMKYVAKKGMKQYFISNGFMVTKEVAKKLASIENLELAEISLHATDFETWSAVTRTKNKKLFENATNAPLLLKKYGIPSVVVAFVKTERNIHNLKPFLDYWLPKVDEVSVVHKLSSEEVEQVGSYYNQFNEPKGLCCSSYQNMYVFPSGMVLPCGGAYYSYTDEARKNLPYLDFDQSSVEQIKDFLYKVGQTDEFAGICSNCWSQARRGTKFEIDVCGYPAMMDGVSIRVCKDKKKKTLPQKIKREIKYFLKKHTKHKQR